MRRTKAYIAIGAVIALIAIFSVLSLALASPEVRHPYPVKGYVTMGGKPVSAGVEVIITDNTCGGSLTATTDNTGFYYREIYQAIPASQNGDSFTCSVSYAGETGSCSFNLDLSKSSQQCDIYLVDTISPQAVAKPEYQTVYVNQAAQFNGSNSTDNVGIVRYHWDFGDGTNKTGETVSNSYSLADTYPVTLTVYDAAGNSDSDTCEVSVIPSPTEHNVTFNVTEPTNTIDGYNVTINETGRITVIGDGNLTETVIIDMGNGTRLEFDIDVDDDLKNGTIKGIEYDTPEVPVGDESLNRSVDIDLNLNSSKDWTGDQNISLTLQPLNDLRDTATWTESAGANATNATTIVMSGFGLSGIGTAIVMHAELSGINETDVESLPISMTVDGAWYRDVAGSKSANVYLFKFYDNGTKKDQKNPTSVHHDATNDTYTFHFEMDGFSVFALVAGVVAPTAAGGPTYYGGGGGSSGVSSGEPFDNIEKREERDQYLYANRDVTYSFITPELAVYEITIASMKNTNLISARIELLKGTSTLVDAPPEGTVYKNLNIWLGTYGFATSENIRDAVVRFKVEKSWLTDNRLSNNDISLAKWESGNWIELSTTVLKDDSDYVYYEAHTTSFSPFAIVGKFVPPAEKPPVEEKPPAEKPPAEKPPAEKPPAEKPPVEEKKPGWKIPGFTSVFAIAGLLAVAYAMMRRRRN